MESIAYEVGTWTISWLTVSTWLFQMHTWKIHMYTARPLRLDDMEDQVTRPDLHGPPTVAVKQKSGLASGQVNLEAAIVRRNSDTKER